VKSIAALVALLVMCATVEAAETVRIKALDCVFEIPADYEINVAPNSSVILSDPAGGLGPSIRISELEPALPTTESLKLLERIVTGPLTVERFRYEPKGHTTLQALNFTIVRGRNQQAKFDAMPDAQVDGYVAQCLKSINPAVKATAARKSEGCASTLSLLDVTAAMGKDVRLQPVFSAGELKGWRLYGTSNSELLRARGITEGALMTHLCDVPAREIFVNDSEACCAVDVSKQFDVTLQRSGEPTHANFSRAP
jgi:hypothetical protein